MKKMFLNFLKDESGQTSTEYILLVAVVVLLVMKFKKEATTRLGGLIGKSFDQADSMFDDMGAE